MKTTRKALALLLLAVVGLAQAEATNNDGISQDDLELEAMLESPNNKFELTKLFAGQYYQNTYKKINDHLVDNLETPNPEANLKFALEWLNKEKAKSSTSSNLIEALTQFTALLKTDHRCDRVAYAILVKNDRATNHVTHTNYETPGLRRIDRIIRYYALKHSKKCLAMLPELYEKKLATMDQSMVKKVEEVFKDHLIMENDQVVVWELMSDLKGLNRVSRESVVARDHKMKVWEILYYFFRSRPDEKNLRGVQRTGKLEEVTKLKRVLEQVLSDFVNHVNTM